MDPEAVGALGDLIVAAIAVTADELWKAIRSSPAARAVEAAVDRALVAAFRDARRGSVAADDDWIATVAGVWKLAFTTDVSQALIGSLAHVREGSNEFAALASQALLDSGCDVAELERTFWVEQFLYVLPQLLFEQLEIAASASESVRQLVGYLLVARAEAAKPSRRY